MLKKEFEYYLKEQENFVKQYLGKFLVIKDEEIVGIYNTELQAYSESIKKFELGTFLIQECQPGEENFTQTFRSRVIF
ncbi:MAG: hypothetical protein A2X64_06890 [Ignavibacteria bacterium GWF2_33_9]|nr:MAG: hypothetical protein A2X64_06890 [Ignavibacteria bacterium GWF2_33_9]